MLKIKALLSVLFLLLGPLHWAHALEVEVETIEHDVFIVQFQKPLRGAAQEVERIFTPMKSDLETALGWKLDFRPTVMLIKDSGTFQRLAGHKLVVAYALPQKNLIVIDYSKMTTHPFSLGITLKHELAHLFLHHHIRPGKLPLWLDEGIAQWTSGGIAEILMGRDGRILKKASLSGKLIPLGKLNNSFPEEEAPLLLAYEESKSFIEYIDREFGSKGIRQVLNHLKDGEDIDAAIMKGLSSPLDTLEKRWHEKLKNNMAWLAYISNNIILFLFFFTALATVYGFIRFLVKKRNYVDDEDEPFNGYIE
ncbi:hypothetical protein JYT87_02370 [Nitrospira defluvii]|nr:hypothetical protein [Nitrospira defluvii]